MKISGLVLFASGVVTALVVTFFLLLFEREKLHDGTCAGVTRIAGDAQKMKYVKSWIASRTADQEFMNEIRTSKFFQRGDPRLQQVDLDWTYLGLTPEFVSLTLNVKSVNDSEIEASKIESVSIGQGRSTIIIRMSGSEDFGLLWPAEELSKIRPVADDVFVYCGT